MIRKTLALLLLLPALAVAACGDDEPEAGTPATTTTTTAASAFPVTIEHKYGSTEIPEAPERVVVTGLNEQDAFIALGTVPVGVTDWMGFPNGIAPWAQDKLGGAAKPELLSNVDGIQYEKVAALQPDVIVALYSDLKKADYDKLSQIAPVVAPPEGHADFGIPYEETTLTVGKVLGKTAEAEKLVADIDATYAQAKSEHPEFAGKTVTMAMPYEGIWVYGPDDPRSRMLTELGFQLSPEISKLFVKDYAGKISEERTDLLDLDAVVWVGTDADIAALKKNRSYTQLAVHEDGRDVFIGDGREDKAYNAIGFQTVLSIPLALDVLVPALAEVTPKS